MKTIRTAFTNALATALYIILLASFMFYMQSNFPQNSPNVFIPIAMLLLFVFSAAFTGILVFGKPATLYFDGKKKEAILLTAYTLGFLFILTLLAFALIFYYFSVL